MHKLAFAKYEVIINYDNYNKFIQNEKNKSSNIFILISASIQNFNKKINPKNGGE